MTAPIIYTIDEIRCITGGQYISKGVNAHLDFVSLDSRKIPDAPKTVFWALSTAQRDAAAFIPELYKRGVRNFVAETLPDEKIPSGTNFILVKDALKALHTFAVFHRNKFPKLGVIGITGSNGKTIVKEWLAELLSKDLNVVKSPRSFNSQIGVPLSILQIRAEHQLGIFEAGISRPGEMACLQKIIQPQIGILTNIGSAHDEGFSSRRAKILEKLTLFKNSDAIILPATPAILKEVSAPGFQKKRLISWGVRNAAYTFKVQTGKGHKTNIKITDGAIRTNIQIAHSDRASIENAVSCFCALVLLHAINIQTLHRFQALRSVTMRLEMKPGIHQCSIINDSYSNDLQSLSIAVDFLTKQKHQSHTIILSDILQSGLGKKELYKKAAALIAGKNIKRFIGIGNDISEESRQFQSIGETAFFESTDAFLNNVAVFNFKNEAILLKGARNFQFEKISRLLEAKTHSTVLTINMSYLAENIRVYKRLLKENIKMMVMVKALAYGSGSNEIASAMEFIRADYLGVAYTDEGIALREAGISLPMMVMNPEQTNFEKLVKYHLEPEIYSPELLNSFILYLSREKIRNYPIHLKIDTGMHRLGFGSDEINTLIQTLSHSKEITVASVFSHLSASDNPQHDDFTKKQFALFKKITHNIRKRLGYDFDCHISNSSAISRFPSFHLNMVRLGIGMYGIDSNPAMAALLKPVHTLTTTISQIKNVKAGDVVGYNGRTVRTAKRIATVAVGYADGYSRALSNGKGKMYLNGKRAPVVGNICMDMTMIDITGIKDVSVGDEVEVFGQNILLEEVAGWAATIPYEIIAGISTRVKRVYVEE